MKLSVDREHILKVAKELDFEVQFDAERSGILDLETGEIQSFSSAMSQFLQNDIVINNTFDILEDLSGMDFDTPDLNIVHTKHDDNVFSDLAKRQIAS